MDFHPNAQAVVPPPDGGYAGNNTAEGTQALQSLSGGIDNTALGFQALFHNTSGNLNTAEGFRALFANTNGHQNTATGVNALLSNTTGNFNTANGVNALNQNINGGNNTATGVQALFSNTSGNFSYLKAHIPGVSGLTDVEFRQQLTYFFGLAPNDRLNMEGVQLSPVLVEDDDFYFHLLAGEVSATTGLIADGTPPFGLYLANFNQVQPLGNPFPANSYRGRYYSFCPP